MARASRRARVIFHCLKIQCFQRFEVFFLLFLTIKKDQREILFKFPFDLKCVFFLFFPKIFLFFLKKIFYFFRNYFASLPSINLCTLFVIISIATKLWPPSNTIISAFFLLGSTYCSCIGFTVVRY